MNSEGLQIIDSNSLSLEHIAPGARFSPLGSQVATTLYAGLFEAGTGGYYLWNTPSWDNLAQKWTELAPQGLRLISIDTDEEDPTTTWCVGSWIAMQGGYSLWRTPDWNSFYQQFQNNSQNMRLVDFDIPLRAVRAGTRAPGLTPRPPKRSSTI